MPSSAEPRYPTSASRITGDAPPECKKLAEEWLRVYTPGTDFADFVGQRVEVVDISLVDTDVATRPNICVVCELTVQRDMCQYMSTLQGACTTYLIDLCTGIPIGLWDVLRGVTDISKVHTVSQSLNTSFHAPAPVGTRLRIVCATISGGARILTARCEIWDKDRGRLIASGVHSKMRVAFAPAVDAKL